MSRKSQVGWGVLSRTQLISPQNPRPVNKWPMESGIDKYMLQWFLNNFLQTIWFYLPVIIAGASSILEMMKSIGISYLYFSPSDNREVFECCVTISIDAKVFEHPNGFWTGCAYKTKCYNNFLTVLKQVEGLRKHICRKWGVL